MILFYHRRPIGNSIYRKTFTDSMINPNSNLILIKNEDKTEKIEIWTYSGGFYFITFCGGQTYKYNYQNVKFYKNPQVIDLHNIMVMKNGTPLYSVKQVLMFEYRKRLILG